MDAIFRVGFALLARVAAPLVAIGLVIAIAAIWTSPPARSAGAAVSSAPTSPTDESKVPHYFGPFRTRQQPAGACQRLVTIANGGGTGAEATATVDPKTGGISAVTVTSPGSGYTTAPGVTIAAAGVTPTALASATAVISPGALKSIAVAEAGFGFTTPTVTITGGNPTPGSRRRRSPAAVSTTSL